MEERLFKNDAKSIVDLAFETKFFRENVTRDDMNSFEEMIQYMLQSRFESYVKIHKLNEKMEKK